MMATPLVESSAGRRQRRTQMKMPIRKKAPGASTIRPLGWYQPSSVTSGKIEMPSSLPEPKSSRKKADHQQHDGVAEAVAHRVRGRRRRAVLHREGLGASHDDAVRDDETDEHRELLGDVVDEGLQDLVGHDHQRGDDGQLDDDPNAWRDVLPDG